MSGKRYDPETQRVVARIRQLVKKYGTAKTAEMTGRTRASISQIKHGHRHNPAKQKKHSQSRKASSELTINSLELKKSHTPIVCRRCNGATTLVTKTLLCVECELFELAKSGVIHIG